MSSSTLIKNSYIVNEGEVTEGDVRIKDGRIDAIGVLSARAGEEVIDAAGYWLLPGLIDDQVHFREPGLTHKAELASESRAAVAGGVTSYMDMPNVTPPTVTMERLAEKRRRASSVSVANYAFHLGATEDNSEILAAADRRLIAGIKIFMGASTGNLLVENEQALEKIFSSASVPVLTHCENNARINARLAAATAEYGDDIPAAAHAHIRDELACYQSSSLAVALAKKTGARLHVLHITTEKELSLFAPGKAAGKQITAEACAHHLLFDDSDYAHLGMRLKCNPAVKTRCDRDAIRMAVADGRIDILATDHAPHLPGEKEPPYTKAAAGLPLIEYALPAFLELVADGVLTITDVVRAGAHQVADLFAVRNRGYIREGYFADLVLVEAATGGNDFPVRTTVLSKCGWTPFAGRHFRHRVWRTYVNGVCVWRDGELLPQQCGMALEFNR